jgi:hypothetical protein
MKQLETIRTFLTNREDVNFGLSGITFFKPEDINNESYGKSVVEKNGEGWKESWLVFAIDVHGDAILADLMSSQLEVQIIGHDSGDFETTTIADSLENFQHILSLLYTLQNSRPSWQDCYTNPITPAQRDPILQAIQTANPKTKLWYWEYFLDKH